MPVLIKCLEPSQIDYSLYSHLYVHSTLACTNSLSSRFVKWTLDQSEVDSYSSMRIAVPWAPSRLVVWYNLHDSEGEKAKHNRQFDETEDKSHTDTDSISTNHTTTSNTSNIATLPTIPSDSVAVNLHVPVISFNTPMSPVAGKKRLSYLTLHNITCADIANDASKFVITIMLQILPLFRS